MNLWHKKKKKKKRKKEVAISPLVSNIITATWTSKWTWLWIRRTITCTPTLHNRASLAFGKKIFCISFIFSSIISLLPPFFPASYNLGAFDSQVIVTMLEREGHKLRERERERETHKLKKIYSWRLHFFFFFFFNLWMCYLLRVTHLDKNRRTMRSLNWRGVGP